MANKIKYGLKNVYYSKITTVGTTVSYGTPVSVPGAVALSISPIGDTTTFYADDSAYYVANANNGYEGSLEIALIPDAFKKDILGYLEDSNGALVEDSAAVGGNFALMFEFSGDANATRHILYNVTAARPNMESGSKAESIEAKTDTLEIVASPAVDTGYVKAKMEYGQTGYSTFFSAAYLYNAVTNTVASATATFSKAAPADITIDTTSSGGAKVVNVKNNGSLIGGIYLTVTDPDVDIDSTYFAALTNGVYTITVEFDKGNAVTVVVTVGA